MRPLLLVILAACHSDPLPATCPPSAVHPGVTFRGTSIRIEPLPIELTRIEAYWDRNSQLRIYMTNESRAVRLDIYAKLDPAMLPGTAGPFHAVVASVALESRGCKASGSISAPSIPARLASGGEPFDVDLDVAIESCEPESVLAPLALRGHVQMVLLPAPAPEL